MSGHSILVIDDSNTNLVLLENLLQKNGYTVFSALSATEGIESLEKNRPDLIYLDLLMPGVDGLEFIRIVKSSEKWKDIPVVILSALSDSDIIKKSIALGAKEYITKPLNIHEIVSLTKKLLSN